MEFIKCLACLSQARCSLDQIPSFKMSDLVLFLYKKEKKRKRKKADSPA